jgi:hypothetical protein
VDKAAVTIGKQPENNGGRWDWNIGSERHKLRVPKRKPKLLISCYEYVTCIRKEPKATVYSTCTGVKYAGNPLTSREITIYKYLSNNPNCKL